MKGYYFLDNTILKQLLTEYDSKRIHKLESLELRKQKLMEESEEYKSLENDLRLLSLDSLKSMLILSKEDKEDKLRKLEEKTNSISEKKILLLKKLNLPADYLSPNFDCTICNDTGYVNDSLCSCIKQKLFDIEYNKSNIANIKRENFDNFNFNIFSKDVNMELFNSKISPFDNMVKIVNASKEFIKNFDSPDEKSLLFLGPTGTGKTFLSNCIAKELLDAGKTVLYQTAPVMFDSIIQSKFDKDASSIMEHILNVDLLIIDDLGTETMNSMKFTELFTIINTRLLNQNNKITKTIISTNMNLKTIFEVYNERIGSRIAGNYNIYRFFGDDIRLKQRV